MDKDLERKRELQLLEIGVDLVKRSDGKFVAYPTRFLGVSPTDEYIIGGKSTAGAQYLNEFCYGYDGTYHELHLLWVYQMKNGKKYAATELVNNIYAFWEIIS